MVWHLAHQILFIMFSFHFPLFHFHSSRFWFCTPFLLTRSKVPGSISIHCSDPHLLSFHLGPSSLTPRICFPVLHSPWSQFLCTLQQTGALILAPPLTHQGPSNRREHSIIWKPCLSGNTKVRSAVDYPNFTVQFLF